MRRFQLFLVLSLCGSTAFAQEIDECRKIVSATIQSINDHSAETLTDHLSEDFTIAGQSGKIANIVLSQLLSQLGETVTAHNELNQTSSEGTLELKYNITYQTMGEKEARFIFNDNNQLQELDLFKMQVKTMNAETRVDKSDENVIEVPFTMAGNLIAVKVQLNGKSRTFLVDSGAPRVILNAKRLPKSQSGRKQSLQLKAQAAIFRGWISTRSTT